MSDKLNIQQKLVEIKKGIQGFNKDTKGFGFEYVSGSQILRAIKEKMDELGVLLIPSVSYETLHWEKHEYKTKKGEEKLDFIVTMKMTYTWVNADDPTDTIIVPWICIGQQTDDISKAIGTALTYNERYFLLKFLGLPTDEDDADAKAPSETVKANKRTELNSDNKWTNPKLTDKQIDRLYAIAYNSGYNSETLKDMVFRKYNKSVLDLTKSEYDYICAKLQKKKSEVTA